MIRRVCLLVIFAFAFVGTTLAQTVTPDPAPPTPQAITPAVPFQATGVPATVVPSIDDSRLAACVAPNLPNFLPYTVRFADVLLSDLLVGSTAVTPAQLAALNCLDDSYVLPKGATIWLPADAFVVTQLNTIVETTPEPSENAEIISFSADNETINNDQVVTLTWEAQGVAAYLYPCSIFTDSVCVRPSSANRLPVIGSTTVDDFHRAGSFIFQLEVVGSDETTEPATSRVLIEVTCAQQRLGGAGSQLCPEDPPRTVTAVWQPFQGGVMMWFSDTRQIYVMTNGDGRVRVFQDTFVEGMPDPDAVAPEGLLTPIRGFGLVWQSLGADGSPLGWAMAQEIGFDSARQPAGRTSYTTYVQGPGETVYAITEVPGMEMGYWTQVAG